MKTIEVKSNDVNIRLDNFLAKIFSNWTKAFIFKAIRTNKVKVNKKKVPYDYRLQLSDQITIFVKEEFERPIDKQHIFLGCLPIKEVIYEDENLLVVNKPSGVLVYDEKNEKVNTLIHQVKKYLVKNNKWDYLNENQFEPCLMHRLDFNTSGLVMVAKNHLTSTIIQQKIKNHEIDKFYLCLVYGKVEPKEQLLEHYWRKSANENMVKIYKDFVPGSTLIQTQYKVLKYDNGDNTSLLEVKLITGKTHQIRSHFAFINHPLVGEQKYISKNVNRIEQYKSQVLIAYKLCFKFKTDAGVLNYLNNKTVVLDNKDTKHLLK